MKARIKPYTELNLSNRLVPNDNTPPPSSAPVPASLSSSTHQHMPSQTSPAPELTQSQQQRLNTAPTAQLLTNQTSNISVRVQTRPSFDYRNRSASIINDQSSLNGSYSKILYVQNSGHDYSRGQVIAGSGSNSNITNLQHSANYKVKTDRQDSPSRNTQDLEINKFGAYRLTTPELSKQSTEEPERSSVRYYTQMNYKKDLTGNANNNSTQPMISSQISQFSMMGRPIEGSSGEVAKSSSDGIFTYFNGIRKQYQDRNVIQTNRLESDRSEFQKSRASRDKNSDMFKSKDTIRSQAISINSFNTVNSREAYPNDKTGKGFHKYNNSDLFQNNVEPKLGQTHRYYQQFNQIQKNNEESAAKIRVLEEELSSFKNSFRKWSETEGRLNDQISKLRSQNCMLKQQLTNRNLQTGSVLKLREQNMLLNKKLIESKAEYYRTEQDLKSKHMATLTNLERNIRGKVKQQQLKMQVSFQEKIQVLNDKNKQLEAQLNLMRNKVHGCGPTQQQTDLVNSLQEKIHKLDDDKHSLAMDLSQKSNQLMKLQDQFEKLNKEMSKTISDNNFRIMTEKEHIIRKMKQQHDNQKETLAEFIKRQHQEQKKRMNLQFISQKKALQTEFQSSRGSQVNRLLVEQQQKLMKQLQMSKKSHQMQIYHIVQQKAEVELQLNDQIIRLRQDVANLTVNNQFLQRKAGNLEQNCTSLEESLRKAIQSQRIELGSQIQKLRELLGLREKQIEKQAESIKKISSQYESYRIHTQKQISQYECQIISLSQKQNYGAELASLRIANQQIVEALRQAQISYKLTIEQLENQLNCQNQQIGFIERTKSQLKCERDQLIDINSKYKQEIELVSRECDRVKTAYNKEVQNSHTKVREMASLKEKLAMVGTEAQKLRKDLVSSNQRIQNLEASNKALQAKVQSDEKKIVEYEKSIEVKCIQIQNLSRYPGAQVQKNSKKTQFQLRSTCESQGLNTSFSVETVYHFVEELLVQHSISQVIPEIESKIVQKMTLLYSRLEAVATKLMSYSAGCTTRNTVNNDQELLYKQKYLQIHKILNEEANIGKKTDQVTDGAKEKSQTLKISSVDELLLIHQGLVNKLTQLCEKLRNMTLKNWRLKQELNKQKNNYNESEKRYENLAKTFQETITALELEVRFKNKQIEGLTIEKLRYQNQENQIHRETTDSLIRLQLQVLSQKYYQIVAQEEQSG